jgi:CDGSH-type Zn-finger protein
MTRLVQRLRTGPYVITIGGEIKSICGCGLSANLPFCDGTHQITKTEVPGKLHWYESGKRRHDAVDKFPGIRSDEPGKSTSPAQASPAVTGVSPQFASDR